MPALVDLAAFAILALSVPCMVLLFAYHWWRHGKLVTIERLSPLWLPLLVVAVALIICYHSAIDRGMAGGQVLTWIGYLAVYGVARLTPRRWVLAALRGLGWGVATVCVIEFFVSGGRSGMWLQDNPNKVGGLLAVLVLPMADSWLWLNVGGAAVLATGSRGAFAGVMASAVANIVLKRKNVGQIVVVWVVVIIAVGVVWGIDRPSTIVNRRHTWQEAAGLFAERPLTGWGPGCYTRLAVYEPEHPHADNWPLTIAAEMGLVGLAAWGYLVVEVVRLAARSPGRARLGLLAFVVHNLVDCTLWWPWVGIVVVACVALLEDTRDG